MIKKQFLWRIRAGFWWFSWVPYENCISKF